MKTCFKYLKSLVFALLVFTVSMTHRVSADEFAGQINFDDLTTTYGEPKVEINLGASMMGLVSTFSNHSDPNVAEVLSKLKQVKVRVYNTGGNAGTAIDQIEKVTKKVKAQNWQPVVTVNEGGERVRIFVKENNGKMDGIVVMTVNDEPAGGGDAGEAVFINIVGEIDPADIQKVTESLNIETGA